MNRELPLSTDSLLKSIDVFAKSIGDQYPRLNRGGCCVFAAHVGIRLNRFVPVKLRMTTNIWDIRENGEKLDLNKLRRKVDYSLDQSRWKRNGLPNIHHVFIEFELNGQRYFLDSNGLVAVSNTEDEFDDDPIVDGHFTFAEAYSFAGKPEFWNSIFDRNEIPALKRRVKRFFNVHVMNGNEYVPFDRTKQRQTNADISIHYNASEPDNAAFNEIDPDTNIWDINCTFPYVGVSMPQYMNIDIAGV